jgi:TolB-like protein/tetratricopeptide (TPR) repeat protein
MTDLRTQLQEGLSASYLLERELGRGGMATVFLAQDLKHDRPVALKVLHPELAASLGPERFLREIKLAARLQHPHILTVLDSGQAGGRLWFTMPFVEGESLRDRIRRERQLPVEDALRIAREAAQALQYAHDHGVVHRDIKPENLLLTRDGNTLVADFGIARGLAGVGAGDEKLTDTGMVVGTPAYMSPEQASGDRTLDARTDVYSLGSVLYEMLAGEPPFTGPSMQAMIVKRLTEAPPSVRASRASVPEAVDQAIRKALAPLAADRFASAAELARALVPAAATVPTAAATAPTPSVAAAPAPVSSASPTRPAPAHRYRAVVVLFVGFVLGLGVLFAWRRGHPDAAPGGGNERRVAVLPFQNLGDSADAYFADGITDAVRGKLTGLPGMRVTASNSSAQYRNTSKTPQEIGRELGVDYLLVGKVRWAKSADGTSRVQVSPELIEVTTADAKWQQPFDASLTDVFKVQADVAGQVAQALDVAIGSRQQEVLADRPTGNLAAYDAFLKGKAARALGGNPVTLRQAVGYQEQAVALDSGFVAAWSALSEASSLLYSNGAPSPALADRARSAADRAVALNPQRPEGYRALGNYYRLVAGTPARAVEQYNIGLKLAPDDADLLRGLGNAEQGLGKWDQALEHLRRSRTLDPRAANTAATLAGLLLWRRQYDEALATSDASVALAPGSLSAIETRAMIHLAQGDLEGARAVLAQPPAGTDLPGFVAYVANFWDLFWVLDDEQRALLKRLRPSAFDNDAGAWGVTLAGLYAIEGDRRRATAYGDSARVAIEQQLTATPEDPQRNVFLGLALAYAGRKEEAIRTGLHGVSLLPVSSDALSGTYFQHQLARLYILVGEPEKALDVLEPLLKIPYYLSPGWLKIDPTFDPLRSNPRFRKLVETA